MSSHRLKLIFRTKKNCKKNYVRLLTTTHTTVGPPIKNQQFCIQGVNWSRHFYRIEMIIEINEESRTFSWNKLHYPRLIKLFTRKLVKLEGFSFCFVVVCYRSKKGSLWFVFVHNAPYPTGNLISTWFQVDPNELIWSQTFLFDQVGDNLIPNIHDI
jgi:hypothetical protein